MVLFVAFSNFLKKISIQNKEECCNGYTFLLEIMWKTKLLKKYVTLKFNKKEINF